MKKRVITLSSVTIPPAATRYIQEIFRTKRLTYGKFTQKFEAKFTAIHGNRYGIMVNSGTSALQIALHAAKIFHRWKDGDEVIVPALTFVTDANVILANAMTPVFVDIDPDFYTLDADKIINAIRPRTRAILVPHVFGQPADMEAISRIAKKYRLIIIEDACEAPFATYQGHPVGHWGEITCFSTYAAHVFTTGVGGLAVTDDKRLATLLRSLSFHGRDPAYIKLEDDDNPRELSRIIKKRFLFPHRGYNFRVTEMEAALGLAQFATYKKAERKRRQNARYLMKRLEPLAHSIQVPQIRNGATHVFMMFPMVILNPKIRRDALVLFLEKRGIETRYLLPIITQPCYRNLDIRVSDYPVAAHTVRRGFYIGCHAGLSRGDLDYIADALSLFIRKHG